MQDCELPSSYEKRLQVFGFCNNNRCNFAPQVYLAVFIGSALVVQPKFLPRSE